MMQQRLNKIEQTIINNHDRRDFYFPEKVELIKKSIIEAQEPIQKELAKYIATHPAKIIVENGEIVPEPLTEETKEFKKNQKEYEKYVFAIHDEVAAKISNQLGIPKEYLSFENCNKAISKMRKMLQESGQN
jgi:hypothetical protein